MKKIFLILFCFSYSAVAQGITGGGLKQLNGLWTPIQSFLVDTTYGTSPVFVSSGTTHTLRIPMNRLAKVADSTIVSADYGLLGSQSNHTYAVRVDSTIEMRLRSVATDTVRGKTSTKVVMPDSIFVGVQSTLNNELFNVVSATDADIALKVNGATDNPSINGYVSNGTPTAPTNITAGRIPNQFRGFAYKDGYKEIANISLVTETDTTGGVHIYTRNSSGLSDRWSFGSTGRLAPISNNTYSIGSNSLMPDTIWSITSRVYTDLDVGTSATDATAPFGEKIRSAGSILGSFTINCITSNTSTVPVFHVMHRDTGTGNMKSNMVIGTYGAIGYDGTSFTNQETGGISFVATENFTPTSKATAMLFGTTPSGSVAFQNWFKINPTGEFVPYAGDNSGSLGSSTSRFAELYAMDGNFGDSVIAVTGAFSGAVSGTTGTFTSTLTAGATGSATVALMIGSGAFPLATYRGSNGAASATGIRFDANNSSNAQTPYATAFGQIQNNFAGIQSGAFGIQTYKAGSAIRAALVDSIQNIFIGSASTQPTSDSRVVIRPNGTGLYALSMIGLVNTTKVFSVDTSGNAIAKKVTADSSTVSGKFNLTGITTDSTTCARGGIWLKVSDGTLHWKY